MKVTKIILIGVILTFIPLSLSAQIVQNFLTKIKIAYKERNYYTTLNLCRDVIKLCKEDPESECLFTNIMKNIYRYKGLAEFEIYKKEFKIQRLENSIQSFEMSYNLYRDAEILYMYGYLLAIKSILVKNPTNLDGLVKAWKGILELYGHDNWIVTPVLIDKIKDYIKIAERFSLPKTSKNYTGKFAQYMILMACDLAEKAQLDHNDKNFFNKFRTKYENKL